MATATRQPAAPRPWHRLGSHLLRFGPAFAVVPNLPFWFVAPRFGIANPGLINLDAILLGLLALFVRPAWIVALFAGDFLLDVIYGIRATFGTNYVEIFLSTRYLFSVISREQLVLISAASALMIAGVALAWKYLTPRVRGRERQRLVLAVLLLTVPLALSARVQRQKATAARVARWHQGFITSASLAPTLANIGASSTRSPLLSFYHASRREHFWDWARGKYFSTTPIAAASDHLAPLLGARPNVVVVLVESWGLAEESSLRQSLAAPFQASALLARYEVSSGTTGFNGTTAAGELRELCHRALLEPTSPLAIAPRDLTRCLPARLAREGYTSTSLDSNTGFWPGGAHWYRLLGFQHQLTFDDFHRMGMHTFVAGPFRSTLDSDVIGLVPKLLEAPGKAPQFLFLMTMSAHLPVHQPLPAEYNAPCEIAAVTRQFPSACGWFRVESNTLQAIAAMAATPGLPPTDFLVVGDHAPPFVDGARGGFSPTLVPYVLLAAKPKP